jgi:hypothetical protein
MRYQASLPKDRRAIGVGQFVPGTFKSLVKEMGLRGDEPFDAKLQDAMVDRLMERRGLSKWLEGDISDKQFAKNLSKEWAGLPDPTTGRSFYAGVGANKSHVSVPELMQSLRQFKQQRMAEGGADSTVEADRVKTTITGERPGVEVGAGGGGGGGGFSVFRRGANENNPQGRRGGQINDPYTDAQIEQSWNKFINDNNKIGDVKPKDWSTLQKAVKDATSEIGQAEGRTYIQQAAENMRGELKDMLKNHMKNAANWSPNQVQNSTDMIERFRRQLKLLDDSSKISREDAIGPAKEEQGMLSSLMNRLGFGSSSNTNEGLTRRGPAESQVPLKDPNEGITHPAEPPGAYPSHTDAFGAAKAQNWYGSEFESYMNNEVAKVLGELKTEGKGRKEISYFLPTQIQDALMATDISPEEAAKQIPETLAKMKDPRFQEQAGEFYNKFARAALAVGRSSIATLGFNPKDTILANEKNQAEVAGFFNPVGKKAYVGMDNPHGSTIVHESMHRGFKEIKKDPEIQALFDRLGVREEIAVRALMYGKMGNVESGYSSDAQIAEGKKLWDTPSKRIILEEIERRAEAFVKQRGRPMGPR